MAREDASLADPILAAVDGRLVDVHTQLRGVVVSYDETSKTCEVKIGTKLALNDGAGGVVYQTLPNLLHVPVAWPSAGGFILHWPLPPGSSVFLTFDEQDSQQWETNGETCSPRWLERFGLCSALAHPYSRVPVSTSGANMPCPSPFSFGNAPLAKLLAIAEKVDAALTSLKTAVTAAAATEASASGLGGMTALSGNLAAWPLGTTACTKLKAE